MKFSVLQRSSLRIDPSFVFKSVFLGISAVLDLKINILLLKLSLFAKKVGRGSEGINTVNS